MMENIAMWVGFGVLGIVAVAVAAFALLILFVAVRRLIYERSISLKSINRRLNRRWRSGFKLRSNIRDLNSDDDNPGFYNLLRSQENIDALIYAYLNDKDAYDKMKQRVGAIPSLISAEIEGL